MTHSILRTCVLLATLASSGARAATLYIATEQMAPSAMVEGGQVIGREVEKVRGLLERAGIDYTLDILPWNRAYTLVQSRPDMCVFSMSRTPEREALFKWVGPTLEGSWVLYGRADHSFNLRTLEDARPLRIGTYSGDARDAYLRARGFTVDPAQNEFANVKKLLAKRIDLWAVSLRDGSVAMQGQEWSDQVVPVLVFNRIKVYLACNPGVPDALVTKMNTALADMRRDGSVIKLERKYDHWAPAK